MFKQRFYSFSRKTSCLTRNLPYALKTIFSKKSRTTQVGSGDVSPFSALMTALAATIGTGNIVGVATAMFAGGPGALVWMWISACFGLTTKFSECMLGFKFREVNAKGEMKGGPMFTMKNGFKNKKAGLFLGTAFALFAVLASFGIGNMTQANSKVLHTLASAHKSGILSSKTYVAHSALLCSTTKTAQTAQESRALNSLSELNSHQTRIHT
jgi:Na+/alanine symporter